ncbi:carboxymuconolactone decarboxylase family protein [Streptomyces sp. NPDC006879]|uniref:carboxymuconolactone decarboxylase family protein n=1 Tax=Streptomyces sp. NPDC006879 TaxID=3364767 RepID=UPI0036900739
MSPRIPHPAFTIPEAAAHLGALGKASKEFGIPLKTLELAHYRTAQINGDGVCAVLHTNAAKAAGETEDRLYLVSGWREAPAFDESEKAALALAEEIARLSDRSNAISDEVWAEVSKHYSDEQLGALVMSISLANLWNRLHLAARVVPGSLPGAPAPK